MINLHLLERVIEGGQLDAAKVSFTELGHTLSISRPLAVEVG